MFIPKSNYLALFILGSLGQLHYKCSVSEVTLLDIDKTEPQTNTIQAIAAPSRAKCFIYISIFTFCKIINQSVQLE